MKTKIFAYRGIVGAETDLDNGKFVNNPKDGQQLGCVIDTAEVEITKEAKELIKNAPKDGGSFAPIMLTRADDGSTSVGLFGFWKHIFFGEDLCIGRTCDISVLDACAEVEMELDEDFKKMIDENIDKIN